MSWQEDFKGLSEGLKFLRREHNDSVYEVSRTQMTNGAFVRERLVTTEAAFERVVWASDWRETKRIACHCCTCDDSMDAACRNHGFYGQRPCDIHNLPGYAWEGTDEMPDSVMVFRKQQEEKNARASQGQ